MIDNFRTQVEGIADQVEDKLCKNRDPGDTHDFSSSGYNGYDHGFISGVQDATEEMSRHIKNNLQPLTKDVLTRVDILAMRLASETVESVEGQDGFGGVTITFSNGDKVNMLYWNHQEAE